MKAKRLFRHNDRCETEHVSNMQQMLGQQAVSIGDMCYEMI